VAIAQQQRMVFSNYRVNLSGQQHIGQYSQQALTVESAGGYSKIEYKVKGGVRKMQNEYRCPLVQCVIDETICYDIQMVAGPGSLINKRILEDYDDVFDVSKVTDKGAARHCPGCPFNPLIQPARNGLAG
jgi:hypothetical protein